MSEALCYGGVNPAPKNLMRFDWKFLVVVGAFVGYPFPAKRVENEQDGGVFVPFRTQPFFHVSFQTPRSRSPDRLTRPFRTPLDTLDTRRKTWASSLRTLRRSGSFRMSSAPPAVQQPRQQSPRPPPPRKGPGRAENGLARTRGARTTVTATITGGVLGGPGGRGEGTRGEASLCRRSRRWMGTRDARRR